MEMKEEAYNLNVNIPIELAANFLKSTEVPRFKRILEDAIKKASPQTKPLSDDEILKLWNADCTNVWASYLIEFARAIEERHGIK